MKRLAAPFALALLCALGCGSNNYLPEDPVITSQQNGSGQNSAGDPTIWRCGADGSLCFEGDTGDAQSATPAENNNHNTPPDLPDEDTCLESFDCQAAGFECGFFIDACGQDFDCGGCEFGYNCQENRCVSPCDPNPCTGADSICTVTVGGNYYCSCEPGYELDHNGLCQKMASATIRLMSANITSGNGQSYMAPGIRMFLGLKPDIVMIQEFKYNKKIEKEYVFDSIDEFVYGVFGPEYTYHRGSDGSGAIPNGIISRFPIKEAGTWIDNNVDNRSFEWARIDIPGDIDLWVVSVHLLTTSGKQPAEAKALVNYIRGQVPAGDYLAIGGDFNTTKHTAPALTQLNNVVVTQMNDGFACDQEDNQGTNRNRSKPYDGVYVNKVLHNLEVPVKIKGHDREYKHGLVFDSRVFTPLSAVEPIQKADSNAPNMQHMPVIRDFKLW